MNRIREWRRAKGWSLQQLAEAVGTSKSQIDKLEKGERRLTVDWMVRIAKPLNKDPREFLSPKDKAFEPIHFETPSNATWIPVRRAAPHGKEKERFLLNAPIDQVARPPFLAHVKDAYAIYITDKSMMPMYRPQQLLFINPYKLPLSGNGVVITRKNGSILVREFVKQKKTEIIVREHHPAPRDIAIPLKDIETLHAVVGAAEPQ